MKAHICHTHTHTHTHKFYRSTALKERSNTVEVHGQSVPALLCSMYVQFVAMRLGCGLSHKCTYKMYRICKIYTITTVRNTIKIYIQHSRTSSNIKTIPNRYINQLMHSLV